MRKKVEGTERVTEGYQLMDELKNDLRPEKIERKAINK